MATLRLIRVKRVTELTQDLPKSSGLSDWEQPCLGNLAINEVEREHIAALHYQHRETAKPLRSELSSVIARSQVTVTPNCEKRAVDTGSTGTYDWYGSQSSSSGYSRRRSIGRSPTRRSRPEAEMPTGDRNGAKNNKLTTTYENLLSGKTGRIHHTDT